MKTLTFNLDCELNENGEWIKKNTVIVVSDNEFYLNRYENTIPVIITEGYNCRGKKRLHLSPYVEWFMKESFVRV